MGDDLMVWCRLALALSLLAGDVVFCSTGIPLVLLTPNTPLTGSSGLQWTQYQVQTGAVKTSLQELGSGRDVILAFVMDQLVADDFQRFRRYHTHSKSHPFASLEALMDTMQTVYVDALPKELSPVRHLSSTNGTEWTFVDVPSSGIPAWKASKDDRRKVVVIHLDPVSGLDEKSSAVVLSKNDDTISRIVQEVSNSSSGRFLAMLTSEGASTFSADHGSHQVESELISIGSRNLLGITGGSTDLEGPFINASGCILVYLEKVTLNYQNKSIEVNISKNVDDSGSVCNNRTATLSLKIDQKFSFVMDFVQITDAWQCMNMTVFPELTGQNFSLDCHTVYIPYNKFSYTCQDQTYAASISNPSRHNTTLDFYRFQIQAFAEENTRFLDGYDCVGFVTVPILMAIFISLLVVGILLLTILAMLNISVNDKYDDAKSPPANLGSMQG